MIAKLLYRWSAALRCRLIALPSGPYLERYHVATLFGFEILLHRFVRSDSERHVHNHPSHGLALVLTGWYREEIAVDSCPAAGPSGMITKLNTVRFLNWIPAHKAHRIVSVRPETWTLFIRGPRIKLPGGRLKGWGFYSASTRKNWKEDAFITHFHMVDSAPTRWPEQPLGRDAGREPLK